MANFPKFNASNAQDWYNFLIQDPSLQNAPIIVQVLVEILAALGGQTGGGGGALPNLNMAEMPITTNGGTDSVDFTPFAGKVPVAVLGKLAMGGLFEDTKSAGGFQLHPASDVDTILLQATEGGAQLTASQFNFQFTLTGAGTTESWNTGVFTKVYLFYR